MDVSLVFLSSEVMCDKLAARIKKMTVDEQRIFPLTNFSRINGKGILKESHHCPLFLELNISFDKKILPRKEIFKLRNKECQITFLKLPQILMICTEVLKMINL